MLREHNTNFFCVPTPCYLDTTKVVLFLLRLLPMLQNFSRTLVELYESAESADVGAFPAEVTRLVGKMVGFDGAVLGMGESSALNPDNLEIHNAFVYGRDPEILADYAQVSAVDPMTSKFLAGLPEPLANSYVSIPPGKSMNELRNFYTRHELQHLLLFGEAGGDHSPARWLVLYRGAGEAFDSQSSQQVAELWPHLVRSLSINRSRYLHQRSAENQHKASALINSYGVIEIAEPLFRKLCAAEWPAGFGRKIPEAVWNSWRCGSKYVGKQASFALQFQHDDYIVSQACAVGPLDRLTPAELSVATKFAAGQSAKLIANAQGISVHTVRSQLTHVYEKLDIHDKAELANYLSVNSGY